MSVTAVDRSVASDNAHGFGRKGRIPIREEAVSVLMGLADDGPEPRLELAYSITRTQPHELGIGLGPTTSNLDETQSRLREQGIEPELLRYSIREGDARLFFVRAADDYRIEPIERG